MAPHADDTEHPHPADLPAGAGTPPRLSLEALATLTGLSPRTIRYYMQEGLVSRPLGAKRGAYYLQRHVEQLLLVRRWADAGLSLERIKELIAGAPADPPPRAARPGAVEVWSRVTLADGLEVHIEPGRAGLAPDAVRALVQALTAAYRRIRAADAPPPDDEPS